MVLGEILSIVRLGVQDTQEVPSGMSLQTVMGQQE